MVTLIQKLKNTVTGEKSWDTILLVLFVISIFINVPLYAYDSYAHLLGEKKDFLIIFVWLSDIALTLLVAQNIWSSPKNALDHDLKSNRFKWIFVSLLLSNILCIIVNWQNLLLPPITTYYLLLLVKGYVLHGTKVLSKERIRRIFESTFTIAATGQAFLAIYQFSQQHSLGLKYLGETVLSPTMQGVAKIEAETILFMRVYGTFSHPNVLAAVLALALLILIAKAVPHATKVRTPITLFNLTQIGVVQIALILTFSRAAWLSVAIAAICFLVWKVRTYRSYIKGVFVVYAYISTLGVLCLIILSPLVQPRTNVLDNAYKERSSYNMAGMQYVAKSPITGIGAGQSLLHMEQSLGSNTKPWEIQPIHNFYLLYASELGIFALGVLCVYIFLSIKAKNKNNDPDNALYTSMVLLIGVLMFFDHYFYTLQPTILVFWLISSYFTPE